MVYNLFFKGRIPKKLPESMEDVVKQLKKSKNKEECLRKAYDILTKKYCGCRLKVYILFYRLSTLSIKMLWGIKGYMPCNVLNYLLRILLIKSGFFTEDDIRLKLTLVWYISIHQYLEVRVTDKKYMFVDPWSKVYGIKFGDYARWMHSGSLLAVKKR